MTWVIRAGLVVLTLLSLVWKVTASPPRAAPDPPSGVTAALQGRLSGPVTIVSGGYAEVLSAPVAGCSAPLRVMPAATSFSGVPLMGFVRRPGDHVLYVYSDWVSDHPDRWGLLIRRATGKVVALLGLAPDVEHDKLLFISEPSGCDVARNAPWRRYWIGR
jgi:hypothetical protein